MSGVLTEIQSVVWGVPLVILLLLTGINFTVLLRGLQLRRLGGAIWLALVRRDEEDGEGDISHFRALMTAMAGTVGTANLVGVATAIGAGGPGALFWMWVAGLLGMATKYAEAVLGVRFRETDQRGEKAGGPMYYLEHGLPGRRLGRVLATAFAAFAAFAAFGIGNGVQSQAVADALGRSFGIPHWVAGLLTAAALAAVILGGIRSIGRVAGVLVPVMLLLYIGAAAWVIIANAERVPEAFSLIFRGAFGAPAVAGGALGYTVFQAIRFGVARGLYSNESGLGTGGIAAAAARTNEPVRQALVSMTQTFFDTIIVAGLTGLAILTTGVWRGETDGANMAQAAFETGLPGDLGGIVVAVVLTLLAFSTMLGWSYYGERSLAYLAGERVIPPYRALFVAVAAAAALVEFDVVWLVSDILNALMAVPNLVGLLLLSGVVWRETRRYFERQD